MNQLARGLADPWTEGDEAVAVEGLEGFVAATIENPDEWIRMKTLQYIRGDRTLKQIANKCSEEIRAQIFSE